ncbi:MAG TPA: aromatic-ring-hydroxylating dioxygenase subunit beta [Eoetvoesiella sp.]
MKSNYSYTPSRLDAAIAQKLLVEIEAFNAEYCAVLDNGQVEQWPDFFCEDGLYRVTSRENVDLNLPVGLVYAEGRDMMHDRAVAIARTQMYAPRYMLHLVTNTRVIDQTPDGEIEAEANYLLLQTLVEGPTTLHLAGRYYDRFVRSEQRLLLKERQVIYDTSILANDLIFPV